jgi:hypothetical protein
MKRLLCLSALIVYVFACCPSSATKPSAPIAETATVQRLAVPLEPTDTPTPLPSPTETPTPADTPQPPPPLPTATLTPEPTQEVSELSFFEIREEFERCVKMQREETGEGWGPTEEWDSYRDSILGKRVQWSGWFHVAVDEKSHYRVVVHMDSPDESDGHVNLILPYDPRGELDWHQEVAFQGTISDIATAYMVFDSVDLTDVTFVK